MLWSIAFPLVWRESRPGKAQPQFAPAMALRERCRAEIGPSNRHGRRDCCLEKGERIWCGTEGSNPSPSRGESAANLTSAATALSELRGTVLVTLISVIFIGAALLIAGIFQIVHAFANKEWGAFLLALLGGALYIVGGLLIAREGIKNSSTAPGHHGNSLTDQAMDQSAAWRMIRGRAAAAGIATEICNHSFRATGITAYPSNGGALEHAEEMAAHESPCTTKLYDRTKEWLTQDEVERIRL